MKVRILWIYQFYVPKDSIISFELRADKVFFVLDQLMKVILNKYIFR